MFESWRVLNVQITPPAMGTAKCSSCIAGMLGLNVAICSYIHIITFEDNIVETAGEGVNLCIIELLLVCIFMKINET